jgi:signal transduction histidine kinase
MKEILERIAEDYRAGLGTYLAEGGEPALGKAYELGRTALADEVGLLELLAIHHEALASILVDAGTPAETVRHLSAARDFMSEAISPFEMIQRGFREANTALHRINERLENEARRIAHVIHDDTGPLLVSVDLSFKELERDLSPSAREQLAKVRTQLNTLQDHLRDLSHELRPTVLDDLGLVPALRFLAEGVSVRSGLKVEVVDGFRRWLPPLVQTALYRIVQEAFANITRHARASHAIVQIQRDGTSIQCSIRDDGIGMQAPSKATAGGGYGLGLLGIRERLHALGGSLRSTVSGTGHGVARLGPLED